MICASKAIAMAGIVCSCLAAPYAAALESGTGQVSNLRIEQNFGLIGLTTSLPTCGGRSYVDVTTDHGRSVYATAMMAMAAGYSVTVRSDDSGTRVFGACPVYDILISN